MTKAPTLNPVLHEAYGLLRLIGMRDRLRCLRCKAVGTWKPHGFTLDFEDKRRVRRWMCKWCGLYFGPEGWKQCVVNTDNLVWDLKENFPEGTTPEEVINESSIPKTWPWRG